MEVVNSIFFLQISSFGWFRKQGKSFGIFSYAISWLVSIASFHPEFFNIATDLSFCFSNFFLFSNVSFRFSNYIRQRRGCSYSSQVLVTLWRNWKLFQENVAHILIKSHKLLMGSRWLTYCAFFCFISLAGFPVLLLERPIFYERTAIYRLP